MTDSSVTRVSTELRRIAAASRPGEQLPSSREIGARLAVGPVTVSRAVGRLVAEGLLVTEPGRGTFVAAPLRVPSTHPPDFGWQTVALADRAVDAGEMWRQLGEADAGSVTLLHGYLDPPLQPTRALAEAMGRAARRPGAWGRPPSTGLPSLRAALAGLVGVEAADVLVIPGGQAGLSTALRALAAPGAPVLCESPTYMGVLILARAAGLRPVPVPADEHGMRPDLLVQTLAMTGARLVYCQPSFANPTGTVMPAERRAAVLTAVRDAGAFVIEDDTARLLALDVEPPPRLIDDDPDGHVVHLVSLTKVAAPSLRIGALVARGPAASRLRSLRAIDDFFVPQPMQEAATELLGSAGWARHRAALRRGLLTRRDALVAALAVHAPRLRLPATPPGGGMHLWCRLPDGLDDTEVARRCELRGLLVGSGTPYHAAEPPAPYLRLTYCAEPADRLVRGAQLLGEVLGELEGH
jgi:DNA-binding transcriptional MocR family regulator